jgi:hypothetical protein
VLGPQGFERIDLSIMISDLLKRLLDLPRGSRLRDVITVEWVSAVQALLKALAQGRNISVEGGMTRHPGESGVRLGVKRSYGRNYGGSGGAPCVFGEITTWKDGEETLTGILGGIIVCGDKNFNVENREIDLDTDGEWLIQVKLTGIECTTDDDTEIFLPQVTTSSGTPEWEARAVGDGYTDNTNPSAPGASGTIILPIGKLTVADGIATLEPLGCGNFYSGQCAGILSYTRA